MPYRHGCELPQSKNRKAAPLIASNQQTVLIGWIDANF